MLQRKRTLRQVAQRRPAHFALLGLLLPLACAVPRGGLRIASLEEWGGFFDVYPQYICEGDPVTVRWELDATRTYTLEAPCDLRLFGACLIGSGRVGPREVTTDLDEQVYLSSRPLHGDASEPPPPETLFAGDNSVPPEENAGSRTVYPTEDTTFEFRASIEGNGFLDVERRFVYVIRADDWRYRDEMFHWGCANGESGGPGWSTVSHERGRFASSSLNIWQVINPTDRTLHVSLKRDRDDEGLPPLIVEDIIEPGNASMEFNGEYYGTWSAVPVDYDPSIGTLICETPPSEPILDLPPAESPDERMDDIRVSVMFGCGDGHVAFGEAIIDGGEAGASGAGGMNGTSP